MNGLFFENVFFYNFAVITMLRYRDRPQEKSSGVAAVTKHGSVDLQ